MHDLTGAGYSRLPTFQVTGGFLCAPKSSASFRFCRHFECVLLNTIVKLSHKVVLLNMVLGVFCLTRPRCKRPALINLFIKANFKHI